MLVWILLIFVLGSPPQLIAAPQTRDTSRHFYDHVMEEFRHGDYEAALAGFSLFIELHSKSPLAGNAQYWIGECQYQLGRYKDALAAFYTVGSYSPVSTKLAASAFKIGQTYTKLGDYQNARLTFDRVLDQFPDGAEGKLARKAIASMRPQSLATTDVITVERRDRALSDKARSSQILGRPIIAKAAGTLETPIRKTSLH
jgi:tol-pal system protein YbgF